MEDQNKDISLIKSWLGTGSINIFGRPFAGKDTQGHRLGKLLDAPMISSGAILRGDNVPDFVKEIMHTGRLIPSDAFAEIIIPYLSQEIYDGKPLILSSVGRHEGEEAVVIAAAEEAGHPIKVALNLTLSESGVMNRWHASKEKQDRGVRPDDHPKKIEIRLKEFSEKTEPVLNTYKDMGILIEVNTEAPKDEVTAEIINKIANLARTTM